jgi:hypothetical protein
MWIVGTLLYGAGLRLQEWLELRVKDVDFDLNQLLVRRGKGQKDRRTMLPGVVKEVLRAHLVEVKTQHERDLIDGVGRVVLPFALDRKYPNASTEPHTFRHSFATHLLEAGYDTVVGVLRCHGVHGRPAYARDRDPDRPWRQSAHGRAPGPGRLKPPSCPPWPRWQRICQHTGVKDGAFGDAGSVTLRTPRRRADKSFNDLVLRA